MATKTLTFKIVTKLDGDDAFKKLGRELDSDVVKVDKFTTTIRKNKEGLAEYVHNIQLASKELHTLTKAQQNAATALNAQNKVGFRTAFENSLKDHQKLQKDRNDIFTSGLKEAEVKLRSSIAVQKAIQQEGANSINAVKIAQVEKERQLHTKLYKDLEVARQRFMNGESNWMQQAKERNIALKAYETGIVNLNARTQDRIRLLQQQIAKEKEAERVANLSFGDRMSQSTGYRSRANPDLSAGMSRAGAAARSQLQEELNLRNNITNSINNANTATQGLVRTHKSLFTHITEIYSIYTLINIAASNLKEALLNIPRAGIEQQTTQASIFGIFGSDEGSKNLQLLQEIADKSGQSIKVLEQAYRRYAPSARLAGAEQESINKSFRDFAEVGTILHLPAERMDSLFLALDQMFAKGVVQSEEIKKQLGNVLPGAVEIGAKAMGKSPAAFMEAMKKNEVIAKDFVPKFAEEYRKIFGGDNDKVFTRVRDQFFSNLQRILNQYENFNRQMFAKSEEWLNTVVRGIGNGLKWLNENLSGVLQVGEAVVILIGTKLVTALTVSTAKTITATAANLAYAGSLAAMGSKVGPPLPAALNSTWGNFLNIVRGLVLEVPKLLGIAGSLGMVVAGIAAIGTGALKLAGVNFEYGKLLHANQEEINQLQKQYALGDQEAGKQLERLTRLQEASNAFFLEFKGHQIELSSLMEAIWNRIKKGASTSFDAAKVKFNELTAIISEKANIIGNIFTDLGTIIGNGIYKAIVTAVSNAVAFVKSSYEGVKEFIKTGNAGKASQAYDATFGAAKANAAAGVDSFFGTASTIGNGLISTASSVTLDKLAKMKKGIVDSTEVLLTDANLIQRMKDAKARADQVNIDKISGLGEVPNDLTDKDAKSKARAASHASQLQMQELKARLAELKEIADTEVKIQKDKEKELSFLQQTGKANLASYYSGIIESTRAAFQAEAGGIQERLVLIKKELASLGTAKGDDSRKIEATKLLKLTQQEALQTELDYKIKLRDIDEEQKKRLRELAGEADNTNAKYNKLLSDLYQLKDVKGTDGQPVMDINTFNRDKKDILNNFDTESAKLPEGLKSYQDAIKSITQSTKDLGATNNGVFDAALSGINAMAGAFDSLTEVMMKYGAKQIELADLYNKAKVENDKEYDPVLKHAREIQIEEDHVKATKSLDKQVTKDKLASYSQMTGAAETMFKKESSAAKTLHSINVALTAARLALDAKEMASSLKKTVMSVAAGAGKFFEQSGWLGFAGVAAMMAVMAGLGYSAFGGTSNTSIPKDSGTTGTVLGDNEASSQSLDNVSKLLQDIHAKEYRELVGINQSVTTMAQGITDAVSSIFRNNALDPTGAFGKTISRGWNAAVDPLNIGGKLPFIGKITDAVNEFLFGSKKVELKAIGIETTATKLTEVMTNGVKAFQFQIDHITKKGAFGGLFGGNKSYDVQTNSPLNSETQNIINKIFIGAGESIISASKVFNNIFDEAINSYVLPALKVDLKDLKGEEAVKKFQEAISTLLDTAAGDIFASLKQFQNLGEGMYETVNRIVTDVAVVRDSFKMVNVGFNALGMDAIAIAESIVKASGDIKEARKNFESFFSAFFSQGAQQEYTLNTLQGMLQDMGLILPETRDGWKVLTQAMLAGGQATTQTAARLLELSTSADEYYKAIEKGQQKEKGITTGGLQVVNSLVESMDYLYLKFLRIFNEMAIDPSATWAGFNNKMLEVSGAAQEAFKDALTSLEKVSETVRKGIFDKIEAINDLITTTQINTYNTLANARLAGELNSSNWDIQFAALRKQEAIRLRVKQLEDALTAKQKARYEKDLNTVIAGESFQDKYNRQVAALEKLQSLVQTKYDKELSLLTQTITAISGIRSHVKDLLSNTSLSPLSNNQILGKTRDQFYATLEAARRGDPNAIGNVNSSLDTYLQQAKEFYASSEEYSKIFNQATSDALGLQELAVTTEQKIETNTAKMVYELQQLQIRLDLLEVQRQETSLADRQFLQESYDSIATRFLVAIQSLVDNRVIGNSVDLGASYGGGKITGKNPFSTVSSQVDFEYFNNLVKASEFYKAANFAIGKGYSKVSIADYMLSTFGVPFKDTMNWFSANGFATGGAFTNGVVSKPTLFNMGVMGEKGKEAILPLANINGTLGVRAVRQDDKELIIEVRALRQEVATLRAENKQHTGFLMQAQYDATDKAADKVVNGAGAATDKLIWNEKSKPQLV